MQLAKPPPSASPGAGEGPVALLMRSSARLPGMPECRICLSPGSTEPLVQPCACAGSLGSIHMSCLAAWVAEKGSLTCELCGQPYRQPHAHLLEPLAKAAAERKQQTHITSTGLELALVQTQVPLKIWLCPLLSLTLLIASIAIITVVLSRHEAITPQPADSQAATTTGARLLTAMPAVTGWQQQ